MAEIKAVGVSYAPPIVYIHCLPLAALALETKGFPFTYIYVPTQVHLVVASSAVSIPSLKILKD